MEDENIKKIDPCQKCAPEDCEGVFCRCESRNIEVGKKLRENGMSPWVKRQESPDSINFRLQKCRDEIEILISKVQEFREYLEKEINELNENNCHVEFSMTSEINERFEKIFGLLNQ